MATVAISNFAMVCSLRVERGVPKVAAPTESLSVSEETPIGSGEPNEYVGSGEFSKAYHAYGGETESHETATPPGQGVGLKADMQQGQPWGQGLAGEASAGLAGSGEQALRGDSGTLSKAYHNTEGELNSDVSMSPPGVGRKE